MTGLTRREKDCLDVMIGYFACEGVMPSHREICRALNITSTSGASRLVSSLVEKGKLTRVAKRWRGLVLNTQVCCPNCDHTFTPSPMASQPGETRGPDQPPRAPTARASASPSGAA